MVTHQTNAYLLAINADGDATAAMPTVATRLQEELRRRSHENELKACFAIAMVRDKMSFVEYYPDPVTSG